MVGLEVRVGPGRHHNPAEEGEEPQDGGGVCVCEKVLKSLVFLSFPTFSCTRSELRR